MGERGRVAGALRAARAAGHGGGYGREGRLKEPGPRTSRARGAAEQRRAADFAGEEGIFLGGQGGGREGWRVLGAEGSGLRGEAPCPAQEREGGREGRREGEGGRDGERMRGREQEGVAHEFLNRVQRLKRCDYIYIYI